MFFLNMEKCRMNRSHSLAIRHHLPHHDIIRKKIMSYVTYNPTKTKTAQKDHKKKHQPKIFRSNSHPLKLIRKPTIIHNSIKSYFCQKTFPTIENFDVLLEYEKQIELIYREKMEIGFQECFLFFFEILYCAIQNQYHVSKTFLNKEKSLLIDVCLFIAETLEQIGQEKLAFFFCCKTVLLCENYQEFLKIGHTLMLMGKIARKINKQDDAIMIMKKALEFVWKDRKQNAMDLQLTIYEELSYLFLQTNSTYHSKLFAEKYTIGYIEREDSKIKQLSSEFLDSVYLRKHRQHFFDEEKLNILFSFSMRKVHSWHYYYLKGKIQQNEVMEILKINFDIIYEGFKKNDFFFYQIPLPMEIIREHPQKLRIKRINSLMNQKFIYKKKSMTFSQKPQKSKERIKEGMIFNFRGVGFSRQKLMDLFQHLIKQIKIKTGFQCS